MDLVEAGRVEGRKTFASQLPVGDVVATWFVTDDDDRRVLGMGIPLSGCAEPAGGGSYFRRQPFERAWRDLRAAKYHPWAPEATLHQVGRLAVGLPADDA